MMVRLERFECVYTAMASHLNDIYCVVITLFVCVISTESSRSEFQLFSL